jgi:hypothetical protein
VPPLPTSFPHPRTALNELLVSAKNYQKMASVRSICCGAFQSARCLTSFLFVCILLFHCCTVLWHSQTPLKKLCRPEDRLIDNKKAPMFGTQEYRHRWLRFVLSYESPTPQLLPPPPPLPPLPPLPAAAHRPTKAKTAETPEETNVPKKTRNWTPSVKRHV